MDTQSALIVDDDADLRDITARELEVLGFDTIAKASDDPDLGKAIRQQPWLVVQGFQPRQLSNPLALHEKIAAQRSPAKLVLAASCDPRLMRSIAEHARSYRLAVAGQISRPICIKQLADICRRVLLSPPQAETAGTSRVGSTMPTRRDLVRAIQKNSIVPWFQPIICAKTLRIARWEVLARWQRDDGTFCPPNQFVRMAEWTGLISPLFQGVLKQALAASQFWRAMRRPFKIALNLSMANLDDPRLVDDLIDAVLNYGLDPRDVTLEITENTVSGSFDRIRANISRLSLAGFPVAIDDFGTGISGLAQLSNIPFDELKLDRHFIRNIHLDDIKQHICRNIIIMAHDMKMRVVAEGIESKAEADMVKDMGVDELQGFHYAYPMPAPNASRYPI